MATQGANLVEEVEDSPDFWSELGQSYNSPVAQSQRFFYIPLTFQYRTVTACMSKSGQWLLGMLTTQNQRPSNSKKGLKLFDRLLRARFLGHNPMKGILPQLWEGKSNPNKKLKYLATQQFSPTKGKRRSPRF